MATVPADPLNPGATHDYCKVLGEVCRWTECAAGQFRGQPARRLERKAVQYGGAARTALLITGLAPLRDARRDTPVPGGARLRTWGTRFRATTTKSFSPAAFCAEMMSARQYGLRRVQEDPHDVGVRITRAFYDRAPPRLISTAVRKAGAKP